MLFFFQLDVGILYWSCTEVQTFLVLISSRRRHTRLVSDWSSDVCSSDLQAEEHTAELQSLTNLVCRLLLGDRKSTRLNSSHGPILYAVFCLKKKTQKRSIRDYRKHVLGD